MNINGVKLPAIGLGTWHMGENPQQRQSELTALHQGLSGGLRLVDTAEMYGEGKAESLLGQAMQGLPREEIFLVSKVYPWNASKKQLPRSLDATLRRLKTDYLDLYLLHWPGEIPLAETVAALEAAKAAGKIRAWGVSNFDVDDMEALWQVPGGRNCAVNQVLYNLGSRGIEFDLLPWLAAHDVPVMAYSPIAQGDSLGDDFLENPLLQKIAQAHGASLWQILLAWTIRSGQVLAIPQSGQLAHVKENLEAENIILTPDELTQLDAAYPAPAHKVPLAVL